MSDIWYGTSGPRNARIAIVGESWGDSERQAEQPFVGTSGKELTRILADAGIDRSECFITNVVPEQPTSNEMGHFFYTGAEVKAGQQAGEYWGLYPKVNVAGSLVYLAQQIEEVDPDIIIACGNYALWALGDDVASISSKSSPGLPSRKMPAGIAKWRGSQLYTRDTFGKRKLVPIYHPAAIMRNWEWRYITVHDLRKRVVEPWYISPENFIVRPSLENVETALFAIISDLNRGPIHLAIDLETRGGCIACIGIAVDASTAICIPFMCVEDDQGYWSLDDEVWIRDRLSEILSHPNLHTYGQNYLYDMQYLVAEFLPVEPANVFDTMLAHHVCWPGTLKGLDYISSLYCRFHRYWKDEGKHWDTSIPEDRYWRYNCLDACATFECGEVLQQVIPELGLEDPWDTQQRQIGLVFRMMQRGVKISQSRRNAVADELMEAALATEHWLERALPDELRPVMKSKNASPWYSSSRQQCTIFYDSLGIQPVKNRKTHQPTVNDEALKIIAKREPALSSLTEKLAELRSLKNFHNVVQTKLDGDGRMRCSFGIAGTETFRWNSSENAFGRGTNLQNISKGHEEDE